MQNTLTVLLYPKNADVACMVLKSEEGFLRENHLFNYSRFVGDLEAMVAKLALGVPFNDHLTICDKKNNAYSWVCSFTTTVASLVVLPKSGRVKGRASFKWNGPVSDFVNAVTEMTAKLGQKG